MEECCGWDFLEWVGPDTSACVFRHLDDPADLVRAGAVSRSWRRFVVENDFSKSLCLRLCPEVANFTRAVEASRSPLPPLPQPTAPESSHDAELKSRERDYRIYSYLSGALVSTKPSLHCIQHCIGASSTDNFPDESMENTLEPQDRVTHRPSYWSSGGQDDPDVPESLTYRLNSNICIIDEIRVQPFKAYFQHGHPIYSSKTVRIRMGHSKLPHWSEWFVTDEDENQMAIADENYVWTYTSPEFPMPQENVLQSFKLPRPVLCIGGVVKIELLGRVQKQATDDRYYICVCHTQVIGHSLSPVFVVDISAPAGYSILKYLPGAKNLWAEYEKSMRRRHEAATSDTYPTQPDSAFHRSTDLHREILELATSAQQMTLGDIREVLQQIAEKARQGIQIATCRTPRDPVDRSVRGREVNQGGSRPRAPAPDVAGVSLWHRGGSTAGHFGDPMLHRHAGQQYAESSGHTFVPPGPELHPYAGQKYAESSGHAFGPQD